MANTQINITSNGTTTLATAGKYCDRNIDINVDVPGKPTLFTNILELDTTIVKEGWRCVTDTYSETVDGVAVVCAVKKGENVIRVRGKWIFWHLQISTSASTSASGARTNFYFSTTSPTDTAHGGALLFTHSATDNGLFGIDKHGDWYITANVPSDGYLAFTLKDMSAIYPSGTFADDTIITINEPIGNGGHAV